jgi:hypothetical protein
MRRGRRLVLALGPLAGPSGPLWHPVIVHPGRWDAARLRAESEKERR